jgi:hypothetical protein
MLVFAAIDRLEYEDWEAITDRYQIDTDESREPDAVGFELRNNRVKEATEAQLIRMLVELALLRSGYSDEALEPSDPLVSAARRYSTPPEPKRTPKPKAVKCAPKADIVPSSPKRRKATQKIAKSGKKVRTQKGGAP